MALFRAVSLLPGTCFRVGTSADVQGRKEEGRKTGHSCASLSQPVAQGLAPRGPLPRPSLPRIPCLSYGVEAQEVGGPREEPWGAHLQGIRPIMKPESWEPSGCPLPPFLSWERDRKGLLRTMPPALFPSADTWRGSPWGVWFAGGWLCRLL